MWCGHCQAEVAGQATQDNQHVNCAVCGNAISAARSIPEEADNLSKDPKELLARWASHEILDPYGPVLGKQGTAESGKSATEVSATPQETTLFSSTTGIEGHLGMTRSLPLTTAELVASTSQTGAPHSSEASEFELPISEAPPAANHTEEVNSEQTEPEEIVTPQQAEPATETVLPFSQAIEPQVAAKKKRRGGSMMFLGQILAYVGVASLTIGTTLVLWGYFGGKPEQAPLGWLVATSGQMLLFLGVVTLVSGGLEQTTSAVEEKIDELSATILRLEHHRPQTDFGHAPLAAGSQTEPLDLPEAPPGAAA